MDLRRFTQAGFDAIARRLNTRLADPAQVSTAFIDQNGPCVLTAENAIAQEMSLAVRSLPYSWQLGKVCRVAYKRTLGGIMAVGDGVFHDAEGRPIELAECLAMTRDLSYGKVAFAAITSDSDLHIGFYVSTAWSGLDSETQGDERPRLFRTLVQFAGELRLPELERTRHWRGRAEAERGHRAVVEEITGRIPDARVVAA